MKILIITLFFAGLTSIAGAQTTIGKDTSCSFLKNLKFKNGADTLVIRGTMVASIQLAPFTTYEESFLKKRGIDIKKIGTSIEFKPEHCTKNWVLPLMVHAGLGDLLNHSEGKTITITCLVFNGYSGYKDHSPYVLVIKAER
jgi:hypothetical protein